MAKNRYTIEKRDREVVERFRGIVAAKEDRKKKIRIRLAGIFLIIVSASIIVFWGKFSIPPVKEPVNNQSDIVVLNKTGKKPVSTKEPDAIQVSDKSLQTASAVPEKLKPEKEEPERPEPIQQPAKTVAADITSGREAITMLAPKVRPSAKKSGVDVFIPADREADIKIVNIATCRGIKNRQVVSRQDVFSIKQGAAPYVWMDVRSKNLPYTLKHVYYLNDRRYCVVPLEITYPRMRTWSTVSLKYPTQIGKWRVDVVYGSGKVLSQIEFSVVP